MIGNSGPSARKNDLTTILIVFLAILTILIIGLTAADASADLTAVTLLYFRGFGQNNSIQLEWATGTEFDTAGFRVFRSNQQNGQYQMLDQIGFVPAEGDGILGANYDVVDSDGVTNGTVYWYKLIEYELNGSENPAGPISVAAGAATATPTSSPTPTSTPTTQQNQQSPTATSQPTGNSQTPVPSPTARVLATSQNTPGTSSSSGSISQLAPASPTANRIGSQTQPSTGGAGQQSNGSSGSSSVEAAAPQATESVVGYPGRNGGVDGESGEGVGSGSELAYPDSTDGLVSDGTLTSPLSIGQSAAGSNSAFENTSSEGTTVIGSQNGDSADPEDKDQESGSSTSTLLLWIGFGASFLIFGAGVIGSILYFSRQRMQGR